MLSRHLLIYKGVVKVSELARLWVFSEKIEDKLFWPKDGLQEIEWDLWPSLKDIPSAPNRPTHLRFSEKKQAFPSLSQLENEHTRGEVLHFFANHELLALELMALTLLKFPQAPKPFLTGLLQTLHDEQRHLAFYLKRMSEYGCEFGTVPVNGFFWNHLAPSSTPFDYTTGMALTFEQANLDFSAFYQKAFEKIGDMQTASVLQEVFEDEIRHVSYGLHWFDRWRNPQEDRWSSYKNSLKFPLTPQRAKGKEFHHEARLKSGLDHEFIEKLKMYSHSLGRVPDVFCFNPDGEDELASHSHKYRRKKITQDITDDLSVLPMYLCHSSDIVLLPSHPPKNFLVPLQNAGFSLPEFLTEKELFSAPKERKIQSFQPWAWTPTTAAIDHHLRQHFTATLPSQPAPRETYSKLWSASLLKDYVTFSKEDFICPPNVIGEIATNTGECEQARRFFFENGFTNLVIKSPFGASGRGFKKVRSDIDLNQATENWLQKVLQKQKAVIIEPWLNKEFDYSLQITVDSKGDAKINGTARFLADKNGQYRGALLGGFYNQLNDEHKRFLNNSGQDGHLLKKHFDQLAQFVAQKAHLSGYQGAIGIDALVYRDEKEQLKIKPIVETNCRWNMGRLVVEMEKRLRLPGQGLWRVLPYQSHQEKILKENFKPLMKDQFEKDQYYYLVTSHSFKQQMTSILFWGPELKEIEKRAQQLLNL